MSGLEDWPVFSGVGERPERLLSQESWLRQLRIRLRGRRLCLRWVLGYYRLKQWVYEYEGVFYIVRQSYHRIPGVF